MYLFLKCKDLEGQNVRNLKYNIRPLSFGLGEPTLAHSFKLCINIKKLLLWSHLQTGFGGESSFPNKYLVRLRGWFSEWIFFLDLIYKFWIKFEICLVTKRLRVPVLQKLLHLADSSSWRKEILNLKLHLFIPYLIFLAL